MCVHNAGSNAVARQLGFNGLTIEPPSVSCPSPPLNPHVQDIETFNELSPFSSPPFLPHPHSLPSSL